MPILKESRRNTHIHHHSVVTTLQGHWWEWSQTSLNPTVLRHVGWGLMLCPVGSQLGTPQGSGHPWGVTPCAHSGWRNPTPAEATRPFLGSCRCSLLLSPCKHWCQVPSCSLFVPTLLQESKLLRSQEVENACSSERQTSCTSSTRTSCSLQEGQQRRWLNDNFRTHSSEMSIISCLL